MAQPITWRNVDAPDLRGSAGLLGVSQMGINEGFKQLQGVLQQQQKVDEANWEQVKKNNTDAFLNRLASTETPAEMAALQSSGELGQMLSGFGAQVDANAARAAQDNRMGILQGRAEQDIRYKNAAQAAKDDPVLSRLNALALQDPINALIESADADLSDRGRLAFQENLRKVSTENVANERGNIKFNNEQLMAPLERQAKEAAIAASKASAASANADVSYKSALTNKINEEVLQGGTSEQNKDRNERTQKKLEARRQEGMSQNAWGSEVIDSPTGRKAFDGALKAIKDPDVQEEIKNSLSPLVASGITLTDSNGKQVRVPLSADLAIAAIEATKGGWFTGHGTRAKKWIEDRVSDPKSKYYDPGLVNRYLDGYSYYSRTEGARAAELERQNAALPKPTVVAPSPAQDSAVKMQEELKRRGAGPSALWRSLQ